MKTTESRRPSQPPGRTAARAAGLARLLAVALTGAALAGGALTAATTTTTHPAKKPPYYHGKPPADGGAIGILPVVVQGASGIPDGWLPGEALGRLAADVDRWLAGLAGARALAAPAAGRKAVAPSVYLGCAPDESTGGDCVEEPRENVLALTGGSREWRAALAAAAAEAGVERVLRLELAVAAHWIHQRNLRGAKEVRLGTERVQALPWLTSLDTPVYVLGLTGAVLDREGRLLRAGGEGLWAVRTPFRASMLGTQKLIQADDVEQVRTTLRETPQAPLVWEAAARQLVEQLLGALPAAESGGR